MLGFSIWKCPDSDLWCYAPHWLEATLAFWIGWRALERRKRSPVLRLYLLVNWSLPNLHADLFSRHASPLEVRVLWRSTKEVWRCFVRRDLSSMRRKTAKKEAWRPKCAAPRLGYEQNQKVACYTPHWLEATLAFWNIWRAQERRKRSPVLRLYLLVNWQLPELHADLFSRHASPLEVCVLWRSTKEMKLLCPTRFVADATENSKEGGLAADVCSTQTGLWTKSKATYYCSHLGHQNKVAFFVGGISERRPTNTTHQHFSVKRCASAKNPCKVGEWV